MSQRFEDNIIKAITTSDVVLLKNTLENSERVIAWNQTVDGLSVLALCVKFFNPEIVEALYPPSTRALPNDIFTYIIEHAPKGVVDKFSLNIIETINYKLTLNDAWDEDSDAEQILKTLEKSTQHISALVNHAECNLIQALLNLKIGAAYTSLLLIRAVEWNNPKLLNHAIEQIEQNSSDKWCDLSYKDWTTDHVQKIFDIYSAQTCPNLNNFLNKISKQTWHNLQKAQHEVMVYSVNTLKSMLNDVNTDEIKNFAQTAPQYALQRLSHEDVLEELTFKELEALYNCGAGCTLKQYGFLSNSSMRFEIPLILEQHKRIYSRRTHFPSSQTQNIQRQHFQTLCAPLLSSIPYAFLEKRIDLELYYRSMHDTSPNQNVSILDCFKPHERAWAEKCLLHEQINHNPSHIIKKSKI